MNAKFKNCDRTQKYIFDIYLNLFLVNLIQKLEFDIFYEKYETNLSCERVNMTCREVGYD